MRRQLSLSILAFVLFAGVTAFAEADPAAEKKTEEKTVEAAPAAEAPAADGLEENYAKSTKLVKRLSNYFEKITNYHCEMYFEVLEDGDKKTQTQKYWFMRPDLFRTEQIGEYRKGTIAVKTKSGSLRAKTGGFFDFVTIPISESMAVGITGETISYSTFAQFFKGFFEAEEAGVRHAYQEKDGMVILTSTPQEGDKIVTVTIDPKKMHVAKVVHEWPNGDHRIYEWRDLKWNIAIDPSMYTLD